MLTQIGALKIAAKKIGIPFKEYRTLVDSGFKWCGIGHHFASVSEFGANRLKSDGLQPYCRNCSHVKIKQSTKGRPAWNKGMSPSSETRQKMSESHRGSRNHRWKGGVRTMKRERLKMLASRKVNHAVEAGILPRPDTMICSQCGKQAKEYHHSDYSPEHWLDVVPVCSACNRA